MLELLLLAPLLDALLDALDFVEEYIPLSVQPSQAIIIRAFVRDIHHHRSCVTWHTTRAVERLDREGG